MRSELFRAIGPHLDPREARIVLLLAQLERIDVILPATREDDVEHFRQEKRIDNVSGHLDVFDMCGYWRGSVGRHRTSPVAGTSLFYRPTLTSFWLNTRRDAWGESEAKRSPRTARRR